MAPYKFEYAQINNKKIKININNNSISDNFFMKLQNIVLTKI